MTDRKGIVPCPVCGEELYGPHSAVVLAPDGRRSIDVQALDEESLIHLGEEHPDFDDDAIFLPTQHAIVAAAENSDHLGLLRALRARIAAQVAGDCPPRDLASLSRRVQELSKEITSIEERLQKDERESNPCKHCDGTGVGRRGERDGSAESNDTWRPE